MSRQSISISQLSEKNINIDDTKKRKENILNMCMQKVRHQSDKLFIIMTEDGKILI